MHIYILIVCSLLLILQETYPQSPPIWFSESEDGSISVITEKLSDTSDKNYNVSSIYLFIVMA